MQSFSRESGNSTVEQNAATLVSYPRVCRGDTSVPQWTPPLW
jgi:hypothetical protein